MGRLNNCRNLVSDELAAILAEETKGCLTVIDRFEQTKDTRFRLIAHEKTASRMILHGEQLKYLLPDRGYRCFLDDEYRVDEIPDVLIKSDLRGVPGQENSNEE